MLEIFCHCHTDCEVYIQGVRISFSTGLSKLLASNQWSLLSTHYQILNNDESNFLHYRQVKKNVPKQVTGDDDKQINTLAYFHVEPQSITCRNFFFICLKILQENHIHISSSKCKLLNRIL